MESLRNLDALRGMLAVYVLLGHSRWLLWAGHAEWSKLTHAAWEAPLAYASALLRFGHEAVMVFFVLSGFFIHLRLAKDFAEGKGSRFRTFDFLRRRLQRLGAPYLLALVATVACDLAGRHWFPTLYLGQTGDALLDGNFSRAGFETSSVVSALVMLPSSLGQPFGTNGPLWSLAYEVVYYACYPAWLAVRRRSAVIAYGLLPLACLGISLAHSGDFGARVFLHYPIWLAGAGLAEVFSKRPVPGRSVVWTALAGVGLCGYVSSSSMALKIPAAVVFGIATICVFWLLPGNVSEMKIMRALEFLGLRSYTIYIVHFPVLALISAWIIEWHATRPMQGWLAAGGALAALAFGCICFEICERHFLHQRIRPTR